MLLEISPALALGYEGDGGPNPQAHTPHALHDVSQPGIPMELALAGAASPWNSYRTLWFLTESLKQASDISNDSHTSRLKGGHLKLEYPKMGKAEDDIWCVFTRRCVLRYYAHLRGDGRNCFSLDNHQNPKPILILSTLHDIATKTEQTDLESSLPESEHQKPHPAQEHSKQDSPRRVRTLILKNVILLGTVKHLPWAAAKCKFP